jgi:(4S)-4-hydroxy-5-phosphonooxypentane-2,3-dione isomerase
MLARWRVRDGALDGVLSLVPELIAATRREPGNQLYCVFQLGDASQRTLVLIEGYADRAAVEAHRQSDHFQRIVVGRIVPLLEERDVSEMVALDS